MYRLYRSGLCLKNFDGILRACVRQNCLRRIPLSLKSISVTFFSVKVTFIFSNSFGSIKVACNYQLLVILTCFGRFVDIGIKFLLLFVCAVTVGRRIYVDNSQVETVDLEVNTHHSRIIIVWIFDLNIFI